MTEQTPATPKRLQRYKRAQRQVDFKLTRRDLDIMCLVESFRLASSAHIRLLTQGSNQGVVRRLQKLFHAGFLDRITPQRKYGAGSAKMVYAITNRGFRALQEAGAIQEPTKTDWNAQNRSLHDLSVNHTLLISHVRAVLTAACLKDPNFKLLFWKEGRDTYDAIEVALSEGYRRIPVAPDAYFGIQDAKGRMYFFLEADRGTMTIGRFMLKLKAYREYWQERKHEEKFGIRNFRVLTVTTSTTRRTNFLSALEADEDLKTLGRMFLFTEEPKLSLDHVESVFQKIWMMPTHKDPHSILG